VRTEWRQELLFKSRAVVICLKYVLRKCIISTAELFQKVDNEVLGWVEAEQPAESYGPGFTRATGPCTGKLTN